MYISSRWTLAISDAMITAEHARKIPSFIPTTSTSPDSIIPEIMLSTTSVVFAEASAGRTVITLPFGSLLIKVHSALFGASANIIFANLEQLVQH